MSWTANEAEIPERLPAPPATSTDVVVPVFTLAFVDCAFAAAREHLATPLTAHRHRPGGDSHSAYRRKKTAPDFSETVFDLQCVGLTGFEPETT
jgi:hypothetical protein